MRNILDRQLLLRLVSAAFLTFLLIFFCSPLLKSTTTRGNGHEKGELSTSTDGVDSSTLSENKHPGGTSEHTASSAIPDLVSYPKADPLKPSQLHVVIAHHSEEPYYIRTWLENLRAVPYVQELGVKVTIYTKGPDTDLAALKEVSGAEEVFRLPNVGREGGTYLHHLLSVYDDPPEFMMFTQSYIKKAQQEKGEHTGALKDWLYDRLRTKFGHDTGFMSLDRKHDICYCGHCTDMGRDDFYPLWPQIYTMLQGTVCQELEGHVLSFNGHFIVSKKRIIARPRSVYEYLKELVDAPEDHWIHAEPKPEWFEKEKGKSTPDNPKFGHTLERLWHTLFNCSDPADMIDCDLRSMQAEGPGGCTCKDFPSPLI